MKVVNALHIVLSYLVLPYLLLWYFFMIMNASKAGHYPYYPDHPPRYLFGSKTYREVMDNFFVAAFISIGGWALLSSVLVVFRNYRLSTKHLLAFLFLVLILFLHVALDPGFAWYVD
jgi:hypothetical protein